MADPFESNSSGLDSPAKSAAAVTPNDSTDLGTTCRALYIGVSGDVKVNMAGSGDDIVFKAAPVGMLPVRASRVHATGTTATDIVAVW